MGSVTSVPYEGIASGGRVLLPARQIVDANQVDEQLFLFRVVVQAEPESTQVAFRVVASVLFRYERTLIQVRIQRSYVGGNACKAGNKGSRWSFNI